MYRAAIAAILSELNRQGRITVVGASTSTPEDLGPGREAEGTSTPASVR